MAQSPRNDAEVPLEWDPLTEGIEDVNWVLATRRREITNILRSYTGYFDVFAELLQNALDAVDRRQNEDEDSDYVPKIWIDIDMKENSISITDNGCGMSFNEFQQFVRPNLSFKDTEVSRGCKGVGATYLAYGFNYILASTKGVDGSYSRVLENGREWVDDQSGTKPSPRFKISTEKPAPVYEDITRGTSITIKLVGEEIRPKDLGYLGATEAKQWISVLQTVTPLGGIYLCDENVPEIEVYLNAAHPQTGIVTEADDVTPEYVYPHNVITRSAELMDFIRYQDRRMRRGLDVTKIPQKYQKLNGIWGEWTGDEILDKDSDCPVNPQLSDEERDLARELDLKLYVYMSYSTEVWDWYNDTKLRLRKGARLLKGGLQLATRNMPQGLPLTIPMTRWVGYQPLSHVIVHFKDSEPDLGRKGFQPEAVQLAEKLAASAVGSFRRRSNLLRKPTGAPTFERESRLNQWIDDQKKHAEDNPLNITGKGLFKPTEELPTMSTPQVEQDVVALFNQMLSSGLVRGIRLISSSQYEQYDALYKVIMKQPLDDYVLGEENPLGVTAEMFVVSDRDIESPAKILEYKYSVDGLIEEFQLETKRPSDIGLAVAWKMGEKWTEFFDVVSYLEDDNISLRPFHGATHGFISEFGGDPVFYGIVLSDLVSYLNNPNEESLRQKERYSEPLEE